MQDRQDGDAMVLHRSSEKKAMIRRYLITALAAALLLQFGYLYYKVDRGVAPETWEVPSILFSHFAEIRKGTCLENFRLTERLHRLSYKKVIGKPPTAAT